MAGRPRSSNREILERTPRPGLGRTHCPRGHPYSGDNLYIDPAGNKRCRSCTRQALAQARARQRKIPSPSSRKSAPKKLSGPRRNQNIGKTHCPRGHPYSGHNLYVDPKGFRRCRQCKKESRPAAKPRTSKRPAPVMQPVANAAGVRPYRRVKTSCPQGHSYSGENLYVDPKGNKRCRECKRLSLGCGPRSTNWRSQLEQAQKTLVIVRRWYSGSLR